MAYSLDIGLRYLRSKKRSTVSVITFVAVAGVALGVAALLAVLSITSGFQDEFRNKVLGVNAHVLVLKYGFDFSEYRDVVATANEMEEVTGAAPFLINEMMLAKGDRLSGVLVKGVDPELMPTVLDLPKQIVKGGVEGLRAPGAAPAVRAGEIGNEGIDGDLDEFLAELAEKGSAAEIPDFDDDETLGNDLPGAADPAELERGKIQVDLDDREVLERIERGEPIVTAEDLEPTSPVADGKPEPQGSVDEPPAMPVLDVPTPEEVEASLAAMDDLELPDDALEESIFEEAEAEKRAGADDRVLPGVVVGVTLAKSLGIEVGDAVRIISPLAGLDVSMFGDAPKTPRSREFRVIGIFEAGFQEYDTRLVYVDLYEAQQFFDHGDSVTGVEMRVRDIDKATAIAERLERELGGGPYHTMGWAELNRNLFQALRTQKQMLSFVIATIIFVAAFNVIATLIMVVLEKKREIAILKAMGARDSSILGIFMVQGAVIGVVGTLIGLVLGGAVVLYLSQYEFPLDPKVYLIDHLPVRVSPLEFVYTVGIGLAICLIATVIPSYWAARLLPADGVRYE